MSPPFFIVGASRSGTTLLRLMLNAHSRLAIPDELKYFRSFGPNVNVEEWKGPWTDDAYRALVRRYLAERGHVVLDDPELLERTIMADGERTLRAPYRHLLEHWARRFDKPRWGEKTPHNLFYVDVLHEMFPDGKFIHVVRDPRAVVQSMNASPYYSTETIFNALNWRAAVRTGERLFRSALPSDQQLTVRYEDLVHAPEVSLRRVCAFLGEAFEPAMLRFYETSEQFIAQKIQTPSIRRPVNRESLTKWKKKLSTADVRLIEALCKVEMRRLGYYRSVSPSWTTRLRAAPRILYWHWKMWASPHQRGQEIAYPFLAGLRARIKRWRYGLRSAWNVGRR